ncbi:GlxA family transcriptional regulator [Iamia sp.]|uniref:GlxA family transcriptional regulator n=1 Tax=Iamia sp. TaxID=2722710 RepID=UPI002BAAAF46|nr:GlxA family transcriptional regulator [Iamia sp.]HXH55751.1 GlxA family transcriptional regulator [Iamia sp.]
MREPRTVVVVAFDDFQLLDLAGPVEVFETANRLGGEPCYRRTLVTPNGRRVRSSSGVAVAADASITALATATAPIDTLVVVGGLGARLGAQDDAFLSSIAALASRARRITSVCTGALVLAAAGLLDGYRATTHWASSDELAASHPTVEVLADRIYVHDRDRWTSAGVTAGIDLALALIEDDHGAALAHQVAGWLVVFTRRPGGQAQFSAQLRAEPAPTPSIRELQLWLPDHLAEDLTVARLAERASMSERSFARAFRAETGTTPAAHVEELRVEAARRLLEGTDLTVAAVATRVGLKHAETLHRAVARRLGTTPDRYRQHFARRAS